MGQMPLFRHGQNSQTPTQGVRPSHLPPPLLTLPPPHRIYYKGRRSQPIRPIRPQQSLFPCKPNRLLRCLPHRPPLQHWAAGKMPLFKPGQISQILVQAVMQQLLPHARLALPRRHRRRSKDRRSLSLPLLLKQPPPTHHCCNHPRQLLPHPKLN